MDKGTLSLDDIVGQEKAITELKKLVDSIHFRDLYDVWRLPVPKGIILTGTTGIGKTASVRALAKELGKSVTLMELRYIDIASRWIDAPIEQLRAFFSLAEQYAKTSHVIIFIDEIESMLPERDSQIHETSLKRVDVFLEWMDGGFSTTKNITVIGATNKLHALDRAARRPGRFDKIVQFEELTMENVIRGLSIHFERRGLAKHQFSNLVIRPITGIAAGNLSGADIPEIVNRVIEKKVEEHKRNLVIANKNLAAMSVEQRLLSYQDLNFFPAPIVVEDIYDVIGDYLQEKIKRGDIEKTNSFGFTLPTATSQEIN
jgi:SpoVK/Ycf46/Vps4 family AAA+-type ATPase